MGNRKYRTDTEGQTGSDYVYDNPIASTVSNGNGVAVISSGKLNGAPKRHEVKEDVKKQRLTSVSKVERDDTVVDQDVEGRGETKFGWLWCRPKCLQGFNTPLGYCFMLCLVSLMQGMTAFGFVFISLSTLEKRFYLNSLQSGSISSAYDFSSLIVAVIVSYMGERGHRPLWVGFGSMLFCAGSITFAIPHFVTQNYVYQEAAFDYCGLPNETITCNYDEDDDVMDFDDTPLASYYWFFIVAQVLHGIGAASLYTLGIAYVDENVAPRQFGVFMGIYNAVVVAGPSLGYIIGGAFLNIYTDLNVDKDSLTIDSLSPLWVGAWWIGFLVNALLLFIFTFIYMGFPKSLPGRDKVMAERRVETQKGQEFNTDKGALNKLKALPRAVLNLLTNLPFMFLNAGAVATFFLVAGLSVFGPKYLESQLSMTPSESAYAMGVIAVTGGISGALFGGILINRMDLKFPGLIKMGMIATFIAIFASGIFFAVCPTVDFAGVTTEYGNSSKPRTGVSELNSTCNSRCTCSSSYDPVCGSDGIMYYTACHAGCEVDFTESGEVILSECLCVADPVSPSGFGTVEWGTCSTSCPYRWLYFCGLALIIALGAVAGVSGWTATIRIVPHSQRAFAMGIQTLFYGLLGTVPGPIVFGLLLDRSCLIWEPNCDGSANCWLYDNMMSARWFLILSAGSQFFSCLFLTLALVTYKSPSRQSELEGGMNEEFASQDELDTIA